MTAAVAVTATTVAATAAAMPRTLVRPVATALIAELVPDSGLGLGINDRLRRAAGLG